MAKKDIYPKIIAIKDKKGVITAFPYDLPGLVVQGDSKSDVAVKLDILISFYLDKMRQRLAKNEIEIQSLC